MWSSSWLHKNQIDKRLEDAGLGFLNNIAAPATLQDLREKVVPRGIAKVLGLRFYEEA